MTRLNERGLSSFFNMVMLQRCFSPDAFLCRLPWSIRPTSMLLGANPPLHNCSLGAKGYCPYFCCLQFFSGKLFFIFKPYYFFTFTPQSLTSPAFFLLLLTCAPEHLMETGAGCWGRGAAEGQWLCQASYVVTLPSEGAWHGTGTPKLGQGAEKLPLPEADPFIYFFFL